MLVTADTDVCIKNAVEELKDNFVFFSPKITFGVDFSVEAPQDMFMYIKGNSTNPAGMFQQATRTRNIKMLFFHGECGNQESQCDSLEEVYQNIESCLSMSKALATLCTYIEEIDDMQFAYKTFFKMFCYTEFANDVLATNKINNFEHILQQNGFDLSTAGTPRNLSKEDKNV